MLLNFSLSNYRSFADTLQFSMLRSTSHAAEQSDRAPWKNPEVSAVSAIYGPNASGKSNFLDALSTVSRLVRRGYRERDAYSSIQYLEPFLLDEGSAQSPTDFLVEFIASDDVRYEYTFTLTKEEVLAEELVAYYTHQPTRLFWRFVDDEGKQDIRFGASLKGPKQQPWSITQDNALFLSVAGGLGKNEELRWPYLFLAYGLNKCSPNSSGGVSRARIMAKRQPAEFAKLSKMVGLADFGIEGIELRRDETSQDAEDASEGEDLFWSGFQRRDRTNLVFLHRGPGGVVELPPSHESDGTLSALDLFSRAFSALEDGDVLIVDELDMSIHPTLVREFVSLFAEPETNPLQAQLIFTTHDVSLITVSGESGRVVDRDQVWFCEKDACGRSELIPATSYSPRKEENLGRNYLNGIYGALPHPMLQSELPSMLSAHMGNADE